MCFSAEAWQDAARYHRDLGAVMDNAAYLQLFEGWAAADAPFRAPKAMIDGLAHTRGEATHAIRAIVAEWKQAQAKKLEQELFALRKRLAGADRVLASDKPTKKAANDQRIATDKIGKTLLRLADLRRTEAKPRDSRIFPGVFGTVMVADGDQRLLRPMRYGCRPAGKPASYDTRYPGTYNARRDNLEGFWKGQFGHSHAIMVVERFYENVEGADGKNHVLEFEPRDSHPMLVACLWSHWTDPKGAQPDLLSYAAITDDPAPEVAAAGHDRTIIEIKAEHVDAWLRPAGRGADELQAILNDRPPAYYEHRLEKAA